MTPPVEVVPVAERCTSCHSADRPRAAGRKSCQRCLDRRPAGRLRTKLAAAPVAEPSQTRATTGHMVPGPGCRAGDGLHVLGECSRYAGCLDAHVKGHRRGDGEASAHCRTDCRWWEAAARLPRATAYVSLNGAARGQP